jgi:hypothetical protein
MRPTGTQHHPQRTCQFFQMRGAGKNIVCDGQLLEFAGRYAGPIKCAKENARLRKGRRGKLKTGL